MNTYEINYTIRGLGDYTVRQRAIDGDDAKCLLMDGLERRLWPNLTITSVQQLPALHGGHVYNIVVRGDSIAIYLDGDHCGANDTTTLRGKVDVEGEEVEAWVGERYHCQAPQSDLDEIRLLRVAVRGLVHRVKELEQRLDTQEPRSDG